MRFSIQGLLALITLSALAMLVYQEKQKTFSVRQQQEETQSLIAAMDPHLEEDLPFWQRATRPDDSLESVYLQAKSSFQRRHEAFIQKTTSESAEVAILHLPLAESTNMRYAIYVPENKRVRLDVFVCRNPFAGKIEDSVAKNGENDPFRLSEELRVELSPGVTMLDYHPKLGEDGTPDPYLWELLIGGRAVCEIDSQKSYFQRNSLNWLTSELAGAGMSVGHNGVHDFEAHVCQPDDRYVIFAAYHSQDIFVDMQNGIKGTPLTYLLNTLTISDRDRSRDE